MKQSTVVKNMNSVRVSLNVNVNTQCTKCSRNVCIKSQVKSLFSASSFSPLVSYRMGILEDAKLDKKKGVSVEIYNRADDNWLPELIGLSFKEEFADFR